MTSTTSIWLGFPPSLSRNARKPAGVASRSKYTPGGTVKVKLPVASVTLVFTLLPAEVKSSITTPGSGTSVIPLLLSSSRTSPTIVRTLIFGEAVDGAKVDEAGEELGGAGTSGAPVAGAKLGADCGVAT